MRASGEGESLPWTAGCKKKKKKTLREMIFGAKLPLAFEITKKTYPSLSSGFYINSSLFPTPKIRIMDHSATSDDASSSSRLLLLGPFCGKPACQFIDTAPGGGRRGVCADSFMSRQTLVVSNVDAYPGHIACDGGTKSEIVCPLILRTQGREIALGVFDLDCLAQGGFDDDDKTGLEKIARLVVSACDW
jgi:L-methionine (R)-S-oxide reductase